MIPWLELCNRLLRIYRDIFVFDEFLVFDIDHRVLKSVLDMREKDFIQNKTILAMEYMSNLR